MKTRVPLIAALSLLSCAPTVRAAATPDPAAAPPAPTRAALLSLADEAEHELRGNILPFWLKYARIANTAGFTRSSGRTCSRGTRCRAAGF